MTPIEKVLEKLPDATKNAHGWNAKCPAHDDNSPSLSISEGSDGRALVHCFVGCEAEEIVSVMGLKMSDLMPSNGNSHNKPSSNDKPKRNTKPQTTYSNAQQAIESLEQTKGPHSASWTYHDSDGQPVGVVVRWDLPNGKKDIRPVSKNGQGWFVGGMGDTRPLYNLPELLQAGPDEVVYIVEGEKCCDIGKSIGILTTTSTNGSQSPSKTNWQPLAGKNLTILPDNDGPGEKYAEQVTKILHQLTPPATVKLLNLPDLPKKGDVVDFIEQRDATLPEDLKIMIELLADEVEVIQPDTDCQVSEKTPVTIEAFKQFPTEQLPQPLRGFIENAATAIGCDQSFVALPLLSGLASAIGTTRNIQLKQGWCEPAIIWTGLVGESGTMKTPAFKLALEPVNRLQGDSLKRHDEEISLHEQELATHARDFQKWKQGKSNSEPPAKPDTPQAERFIVSDATVESLAPILQNNPRGLLLARDELSGWIGSFDKYSRGDGDSAFWLSAHSANSATIDRKTGTHKIIHIPIASVCITGGIQPGVLQRALSVQHRESGLAARLLLCYPPRRTKVWSEACISDNDKNSLLTLYRRLYALLPDENYDGESRPKIVTLGTTAKTIWVKFYDDHAVEQADLTGDLSAAWSKLEGYAARLALVVHCIREASDDPTLIDPLVVDAQSIAAGIELSKWFGNEARRIYSMLDEDDAQRDQRRTLELIQNHGGNVSIRDWTRIRSKPEVESTAELSKLVQAGLGKFYSVSSGLQGGRPSKRFTLHGDGTN